jgi:hypothetical protein
MGRVFCVVMLAVLLHGAGIARVVGRQTSGDDCGFMVDAAG